MKQRTLTTQVKTKTAQGFTLIELMIVIAIIGIMSTFALPSWQERVIRSQVEEGIRMVSVIQEAQTAYWRKNGRLATSNAALGLPEPDKFIGNFVRRVEVEDGAIHITYGNRINRNALDKVLSLRAAVVKDSPVVPPAWVCAQAGVPQGMEVQGTNRTDLPRWFLPLDCLS